MSPQVNLTTGNAQIDDLNKNLQDALLKSQNAAITGLNQQLRNQNAAINNAANASGLLYSGMPAFLQQQYVASTYLPAMQKLQANMAKQQMSGLDNAVTVANQIRAINQQVAKLNAS